MSEGEPPEDYVWILSEADGACTNRQYNCGHTVYAPSRDQPQYCPECNGLAYEDGEWVVR